MAKRNRTSRSDELPDPLECVRRAWNDANTVESALRDLHESLSWAIDDLDGSGYEFEFSGMPDELAHAIDILSELSGEIGLVEDALRRARRAVVEPEA